MTPVLIQHQRGRQLEIKGNNERWNISFVMEEFLLRSNKIKKLGCSSMHPCYFDCAMFERVNLKKILICRSVIRVDR